MVPQWFCSIQESFSIVGEPSGYCRRKHHPLLESVRESLPPYMQNTCVYGLMSFALFFPMVLNHSHLWLISLLWELASLICNGCSLASLIKNLEFFQFTQMNLASLINKPWVFSGSLKLRFSFTRKNSRFVDSRSQIHISFTGKTQGFLIWEAKLQALLINEANSRSALINLDVRCSKPLEKKSKTHRAYACISHVWWNWFSDTFS